MYGVPYWISKRSTIVAGCVKSTDIKPQNKPERLIFNTKKLLEGIDQNNLILCLIFVGHYTNRFERLIFNTQKLLEGIDQKNLILCLILVGHYSWYLDFI